ncbi:hypothetical protein LTR84_009745 [Exophiala bonariae]|uniref:tRNA(Ile)-lysidine synthetase n=1 Tax=Exophiala bonariae TaxID=1690606 RepID=A0AAV9NKR5_9EURO|nr:hypothetical protein LTR84_009745 [Exophiala bonariae]
MATRQSAVRATDLLAGISELWKSGLQKEASAGPARIGVCVSGGPDSMALAYLLNQIPQIEPDLRIKPVALIVNHNARPGSALEAESVARRLEKHNIESHVLDMRWATELEPLKSTRFEMVARSNRYQLIAQAALQGHIRHLFLGHHLDDQVETVMMRLIRNTNTSFLGFRGMAERSNIPCCENIRGAHESVEFRTAEQYVSHNLQSRLAKWSKGVNNGRPVGVSDAQGLQLHRPLLQFSKSQLIKTCLEHEIEYVTDKTNFDPTLTMRNAVRHMRATHKLPRALQPASVLHLMTTAQQSSQSLKNRGEALLSHVQVVEFDLRMGSMKIKLSQDFGSRCKTDTEAAAYALSRLMSVISPQDGEARVTLAPEARVEEFIKSLLSNNKTATHQIDQTSMQRMMDKPYLQPGESLWKLYRPPMRPSERMAATMMFELSSKEPADAKAGVWSEWKLWDHRYWIRVKAQSAEQISSITIRDLCLDEDRGKLRDGLPENNKFWQEYKELALGKMKWPIPVLTWKENIAVFPTLNVRVPERKPAVYKPQQPENSYPILEWEICYRSLDQSFIQDQKDNIVWKNV